MREMYTPSVHGSWIACAFPRDVGCGDLGRLLRSLSGRLRDDARTRSELQARQAWSVNGVHALQR